VKLNNQRYLTICIILTLSVDIYPYMPIHITPSIPTSTSASSSISSAAQAGLVLIKLCLMLGLRLVENPYGWYTNEHKYGSGDEKKAVVMNM